MDIHAPKRFSFTVGVFTLLKKTLDPILFTEFLFTWIKCEPDSCAHLYFRVNWLLFIQMV